MAVVLAATFILPDLGRPERVLNIPLYFNPSSPMVWDITIVMVYMGLSATYVWLYARADLARRGSWLALGTGTSRRTMAREERAKSVMAWVALPAAILLHSITAWIFGLQIGRGFWYSSIMAPMFITSALVSGLGLVILLALLLRRLRRLSFADDLVALLGGLLGMFIVVEAFLILAEYLTALYPGAPEGAAAARMLSGPYRPLFLFEVVVGLGVPFLILAIRPLRRRPAWVAVASAIGIVGIFVHRLNLVLNGLSFPNIGLPPGLPIGVPQAGILVRGELLVRAHDHRVAGGDGHPGVRGAAVHDRGAVPADAGARGALSRGRCGAGRGRFGGGGLATPTGPAPAPRAPAPRAPARCPGA